MKKRDSFLNQTSAEMATCTESIIAADLGMSFDYDGKLAENIVKENYSSFLKIYNDGLGGFEIDDITTGENACMVAFTQDGNFKIVCNTFVLTLPNYDHEIVSKWKALNTACALYLELEADTTGYIVEY